MPQRLGRLKESPSQTAGPYVHIGLTPNFVGIGGVYESDLGSAPLCNEKTRGERIEIRVRVIDGAGTPLKEPDSACVLLAAEDQLGFLLPLRHLLPRRHRGGCEHRHDAHRDQQSGHRISGLAALELTP